MVSNGNVVITKFISKNKTCIDNIIVMIYKICLKISIDRVGWLYKINSDFIDEVTINENLLKYYVIVLRREQRNVFNDIQKCRYEHMIKILNDVGINEYTDSFIYGTNSFYMVFEKMIDRLFNGIDEKSAYNPKGTWEIDGEEFNSSSMRPDTIMIDNQNIYIIDSKYYRYGVTGNVEKGLPNTQSIQKQITYAKHLFEKIKKDNVYNAFLLPYDKTNNKFSFRGNLGWIGKAKTNWDSQGLKYEKIHTFLIDLRYVIEHYDKNDNQKIIADFKQEISQHLY